MNSVWVKDINKPKFPALNKDINTDILIIGGGMAGILCAYMLKSAGADCLLTEAKKICGGITQNTTAKITLQHGLIYHSLLQRFGKEKALLFYKAQKEACEKIWELCADIECDYEQRDFFVYSLNDREKLFNELSAIKLLGGDADLCARTELPFKTAGAVRVKGQAQFHPLKFAYALSKDLPIYENTKVLELLPHKAVTENGVITWKKLIIATHFPIDNKHGSYFLKLYQHRSYVLALKGAQKLDGMYVDHSQTGLSFRPYKDLLLVGGGGHRTGKKGGNWKELADFAKRYYPSAQIVNKWATQDCMSLDGVPYIGRYSKNTPDMFVATGFNKWGMSSSMVSALILADMVQGRDNPYSKVFDPSRSVLTPQLAVNAFESALGVLTPTVPRCSHLGCALKYNPHEHSWDCPCHGSRFDQNGKLLDNPATDDKSM